MDHTNLSDRIEELKTQTDQWIAGNIGSILTECQIEMARLEKALTLEEGYFVELKQLYKEKSDRLALAEAEIAARDEWKEQAERRYRRLPGRE